MADNQETNEINGNGKNRTLLSLVDKRIHAIIAILVIVFGFAFFGVLLALDVPDPKREIIIFVLGAVTSYVSLVLSYFFGSSEEKDKSKTLNGENH